MSAQIRCHNCRAVVALMDPMNLAAPGVGVLLADAWSEHLAECKHTCHFCRGQRKDARNPTCGSDECSALWVAQRVLDRIDDVETLLLRTHDAGWIAQQVGLKDGSTLRRWLRKHGRADLADGPLAWQVAA